MTPDERKKQQVTNANKRKSEMQQAKAEGRVGPKASQQREQDTQRAMDEGRVGPKATQQREAEMQRAQSEGRVGPKATEQRQQEMQQARDEGRIGPKATEQRKEEMRRAKAEGRIITDPTPLPQSIPPAALPAQKTDPTTLPISTISADDWNQSANTTVGGFLRVGFEQTMAGGGNLPHGRIPNRTRQVGFKHPWTIKPFYNESLPLTQDEQNALQRESGAWCVNIEPGFINGHPPAIKMMGKFLNPTDKIWGNNYGKTKINPDSLTQILLTDNPTPFIKITGFQDSRAKVYGASGAVAGGEVPLFFRVRGAMKADPLDALDVLSNILAGGGSEFLIRLFEGTAPLVRAPTSKDTLPEGNRLLYRADIVLQVDKPALKQNLQFDDIGLLRLTGFDVTMPERNEYSARLYSVGIYTPPPEPTYWDIIYGDYQEIPYDEIVIGTLWLLSPVHRDNDIPDGSWLAFPRHEVYWNLNYASIVQIDPVKIDQSLEYFKQILGVLAGGAAYLFAVSVVNPLEATYNTVLTAFNQSAVRGQFWTG